jgi:hypothetical protein
VGPIPSSSSLRVDAKTSGCWLRNLELRVITKITFVWLDKADDLILKKAKQIKTFVRNRCISIT